MMTPSTVSIWELISDTSGFSPIYPFDVPYDAVLAPERGAEAFEEDPLWEIRMLLCLTYGSQKLKDLA
jgi:hypothetical protein